MTPPEKERIENPTSPAHRTESQSHLHYKGGFKKKESPCDTYEDAHK
jgi:hypothetical protein